MLMNDVLVRGDKNVEGLLRFGEKIPIVKLLPTQLKGVADLMARENIFEGLRNAVVQQDFHPTASAEDSRAANAKTSSTWFLVTPGNQDRKSSREAPDFRFENKAETGTRVPRNAGVPLSLLGSVQTEGQADQSNFITRIINRGLGGSTSLGRDRGVGMTFHSERRASAGERREARHAGGREARRQATIIPMTIPTREG